MQMCFWGKFGVFFCFFVKKVILFVVKQMKQQEQNTNKQNPKL